MYIEPIEGIPDHISPDPYYVACIDADPQDVYGIRKEWKAKGYEVICVPI